MRLILTILLGFMTILLAGCNTSEVQDGAPNIAIDVSKIHNAVPRYLPKSRYGNPQSYVVLGHRYFVLPTAHGYNKRGIASWYGTKFHGQLTSTRKPYNMFAMTAASPTLPIPCFVRVTNLENGLSVIVKVNDRGPFAPNRILDMSYAAAKKLGYEKKGTALVQVTAITERNPNEPAPIHMKKKPKLYLQIGAFSNYAYAERLKNKLRHLTSKPIRIHTTQGLHHPWYKVQIGPLIGVGESDSLVNMLVHRGYGDATTIIG